MPLTRLISFLRKDRLNPRLLRYVLSSFVRSLKVSSEEQIRRSLRAKDDMKIATNIDVCQ